MQRAFDLIKTKLEEWAFWTGNTYDEDGYSNDDSEEVVRLDKAIEIVNQVASEYCEEVCEWERQDLTVGFQSWFTKCRETGLEMQGHIFNEWKFCPYCGKKIKAIEPYKAESEE